MPVMLDLLGGHKILDHDPMLKGGTGSLQIHTPSASLLSLDACLGIDGLPQSATGQASLMTGTNVPAWLGYHEGPKPTPPIVDLLKNDTLFTRLQKAGKTSALINAFPPRYFQAIQAGYRIPGAIALSVYQAGIQLKTEADLYAGNAISADFTAEGWRSHLGYADTPVLSLPEAGERLGALAVTADLTIFEYWLTDIAGHHQEMDTAVNLLETFDQVLGSLVNTWDHENGLILITSDHGNLEDLSTRRHTRNAVPLVLIGSEKLREEFITELDRSRQTRQEPDLTDIAPSILGFLDPQ